MKLNVNDFKIGMTVFCEDFSGSDIGTIIELKESGVKIKYCEENSGRYYLFNDATIKPILRRLEDITEEDKDDFYDKFIYSYENSKYGVKLKGFTFYPEGDIWYEVTNRTLGRDACTYKHYKWFRSRGFDIDSYIKEGLALDEKILDK